MLKEVDGNTLSIRTRQQSGDLGAMELPVVLERLEGALRDRNDF